MEKLFRPRNLLSSLYVRQAGSYLVVTHISLVLTFYQVAMQLDWDDAGLCKSLTEKPQSRQHAGKKESPLPSKNASAT